MSKYRDKKVLKNAVGTRECDFPPKAKGVSGRKLPTHEEAVRRTDNTNIKIRKVDQVSASFAMRARRAKLTVKNPLQN